MTPTVPARLRTAALAAALLALPLATPALAPSARADDPKPSLAADAALARSFASAFVHVELVLRYDEGEPPRTLAGRGDYATWIEEERPIELAGIVLAADRVLVFDPELHPRFVASMTVVHGTQRVAATPFAWVAEGEGLVLALERPLEGVTPPAFDASRPPPYRGIYHGQDDDVWTTVVGSVLDRITIDEDGRELAGSWRPAIVVDKAGTPVGVTLEETVAADGKGWKGSPLAWPLVPAAEHAAAVEATMRRADAGLLRVHVKLRSPKNEGGGGFRFRSGDDDEEGNDTERNVVGLVVSPRRVVVLASLDAAATARIEGIDVHPAAGDPVPATFVCSFKHLGAFLVEVAADLPSPLVLATTPIRARQHHLLFDAQLELQGERRRLHVSSARLGAFRRSWRRQWIPNLWETGATEFVFDREGALVAFPVQRRSSAERSRWRRSDGYVLLSPEYLAPLLADPAAHADAANVPVAAEREDRLAWLGVETQGLDRDLARVNGVSAVTRDGASGVLVSYVYAGSPAEKAGLRPGDVLLRIHAPDRPAPIPIGAGDEGRSSFRDFFESMGDDLERFEGMMPGVTPWPSADNGLNRTLTKLGTGKPFRLEYAVDGVVKQVEMTVTEGPPHFDAAPLWKSEPLGVTVRDLTYEVRRHYQLDAAFAGVIVSKIERGGRAAVAGLRPFDIVLRVNDAAVADAAAFQRAVEGGGELRLAVKDKLKERVVKIAADDADGAAPTPAGGAAPADDGHRK